MKLLYLWVENHKEMVKNQYFNISNSYHISFDIEFNRLHIYKNKKYIENFYGNNILDITAIVGKNGTGKTTITRSLYDICDSVHPVDDDEDYPAYITKHIVVYEKESQQEGEASKLIIHYFLSEDLKFEITEKIVVDLINLKDVKGEEFERAEQQHDLTTVYFTNAFEISNVVNNQGAPEFSIGETHKSLIFSPMLSLNRAFIKLKEHYGSNQINGGMLLSVIEQYAKSMNNDFKTAYATALTYNYLIATHSPIILSDIPKDKIIYLKEPFEAYQGEHLTFGANISALFYDSFFMEQGSIGAIARKEIQWAIDNIENTNLNLDDRKRLVYIINNVGDKFLRGNLKLYPIYIESAKENRDDL